MFHHWLCRLLARELLSRSRRGRKRRALPTELLRLEARDTPATITVTSLADFAIGVPHVGVTLRDAVAAANTNISVNGSVAGAGADEIVFNPALAGTITLTNGELLLNDVAGTTITGLGAGRLTIDANNASRIFNCATAATIQQLKLTRGSAVEGGAILAFVNLTLFDNYITQNESPGGGGGGVSVGGTLVATRNTIANNTSTFNGGGVAVQGPATFVNCTIANNTSAPDTAGGVYAGGNFTAINCTITGNAGDIGSGVLAGGVVTVTNTIIAGNLDSDPLNPQLGQPGGAPAPTITASIIGGDPTAIMLGSVVGGRFVPLLEANVGSTPTVALKLGGPAIEAGTSAGAPATDQRGVARGNPPDIGAYEFSSAIGVYRPGNHTFYLDFNGNGKWDGAAIDRQFRFGISGDTPITGDWSGTGKTRIGVYRPGNQTFYLDFNGNGQWDGAVIDRQFRFGISGDVPITGDWDGDGKTEIGVYRPSNRFFCLDFNGNGQWNGAVVDRLHQFGLSGDTPITGDWDGDGKTEIGVYRPSNRFFCLDLNGNGQWDGPAIDGSFLFGNPGDTGIAGDWTSSGKTKIGVFRASHTNFWLDWNANNQWDGTTIDRAISFGATSDRPLAGHWF